MRWKNHEDNIVIHTVTSNGFWLGQNQYPSWDRPTFVGSPVSPASVKYRRNLGWVPEPVRTDQVFISMWMSIQGSQFIDSSIVLPSLTDWNCAIGAQSDQSGLNRLVAMHLSSMSTDSVRFV